MFPILKKGAKASLPSTAVRKYDGVLPVKESKAADVAKIVEKYIPDEYKDFYNVYRDADVSSDTDCSDS